MRLTPAQIGVHLICGQQLPIGMKQSLAERLKSGRKMLVDLSGVDFRYDLPAWHKHLKESRDGGYTWARTVVLPSVMIKAMASEDWRRAVHELESEN